MGNDATGAALAGTPSDPCRSQYKHTKKAYRTRNWAAYERGLRGRGDLENTMARYKSVFGPSMRARSLAGQRLEARLGCRILNEMVALGMPDSMLVA